MRLRTIGIIVVLAAVLAIGLDVWLSGWENVQIRLSGPIFLMMIFSPILIPLVVIGFPFCGMMGMRVAERKMRVPAEGFLLGLLLGPLGLWIETALPPGRSRHF